MKDELMEILTEIRPDVDFENETSLLTTVSLILWTSYLS